MIINGINFDRRCDLEKIESYLRIERKFREYEAKKRHEEFMDIMRYTNRIIDRALHTPQINLSHYI